MTQSSRVQALARALLPDGPDGKPALRPTKHPPATLRAMEALVPELASMLEVRSGCMSSLGDAALKINPHVARPGSSVTSARTIRLPDLHLGQCHMGDRTLFVSYPRHYRQPSVCAEAALVTSRV